MLDTPKFEEDRDPTTAKRVTTTSRLFDLMLKKIETGEWSVGNPIPSERTLMEEFGVSRIALREAMSMLRAMGVLEISHGRSTTIRRINAEVIGRLFPLMMSTEGERTLTDILEVRIGLEAQTAYLAAKRRDESDIERMSQLVQRYEIEFTQDTPESIETDQLFHVAIAKASRNTLFNMLLSALAGFVKYAQRESGKASPEHRAQAIQAHRKILNAIKEGNAVLARDEMISHLKSSFDHILANQQAGESSV
jgi:GntR family transcriptional repressor for pyruvate dehydrogenase complex